VARQRQRARDRKGRGTTPPGGAQPGDAEPTDVPSGDGAPGDVHPGEIHRANIPGSLDHASFAEDEFEADIVAGSQGGLPVGDDPADAFGAGAELVPADVAAANAIGDDDQDGDGARGPAPVPTKASGNRVFNFLRASWAELQRVQWPDRKQVAQATAVVAGFVIVAGLYLGLADTVAQKIVNYILDHSL
jgi:preprotein translocase subunit SecE